MNIFKTKISHFFIFIVEATFIMAQKPFYIHGHRGTSVFMPENTIPAFKKALDLGADNLEMDVVVTKDHQLVVSHERFLSSESCLTPEGKEILKSQERSYHLYKLTYDQIKDFDCGSKFDVRFPNRTRIRVGKPLLREVITEMETYRSKNNLPEFDYVIEVKTREIGDNLYHPAPEAFCDLLYKTLQPLIPLERILISSFDTRVLKILHQKYPQIRVSALTYYPTIIGDFWDNLGFIPAIYSPYYENLKEESDVQVIQALGMLVIPWTINDMNEMKRLKELGVDGVFTDYPDQARLLKEI